MKKYSSKRAKKGKTAFRTPSCFIHLRKKIKKRFLIEKNN